MKARVRKITDKSPRIFDDHHIDVGRDYNGHIWCFDPINLRFYAKGDNGDKYTRGFECLSLERACEMLMDEDVP